VSRRKKGPREERRREHVELNLLAPNEERGPLSKARRGCAIPFLGGILMVIALEVALRA
jgi:hypothetical protein